MTQQCQPGATVNTTKNGLAVMAVAGGRALDCFAYHGSFAIHLAGRAERVLALDVSADALRAVDQVRATQLPE